jgi:hypothetical protein
MDTWCPRSCPVQRRNRSRRDTWCPRSCSTPRGRWWSRPRSCPEPGGGPGHAAPPGLPRADLLLVVSSNFLLVASYCPTKNSRVLKKMPLFFSVLAAAAALMLSPSSWFLLRLLQALSQCCDARCSSTAPTIVTGFLACICTCVDFVFGIFSRASFPARRLLLSL